mmetsp:Transcript_15275/g.27177  ORF Transcript_15275/g.27177 Transcript_15275/m.27177 type:complete len:134 (+) Transcript_15275:47-448(+)
MSHASWWKSDSPRKNYGRFRGRLGRISCPSAPVVNPEESKTVRQTASRDDYVMMYGGRNLDPVVAVGEGPGDDEDDDDDDDGDGDSDGEGFRDDGDSSPAAPTAAIFGSSQWESPKLDPIKDTWRRQSDDVII